MTISRSLLLVLLLLTLTPLGECASEAPSASSLALSPLPSSALLTQATLWLPFEFKSPAGFVVQHNGVFDTLAVIDSAYHESGGTWKEKEPLYSFAVEFAPSITRIVYFPMTMETKLCEKSIRSAVAENGAFAGYTIIVNGSVEREDLPQVFREAFWRLFLVISGKKSHAAWTGEGCLQ